MTRLFDHPEELAVLRMFAKDPQHWKDPQDVRRAIEWLASDDHRYSGQTYMRLRAMEEAGLIEGRKASTASAGREWRLVKAAALKRATGGIDVLRLDRDEVLQMATDVRRARVEYTPKAYLLAPGNRAKAERAIRQCPSPWALGERMQAIKWNNPELAL